MSSKIRSIIVMTDRIIFEYLNYTTKTTSITVLPKTGYINLAVSSALIASGYTALLYDDCTRYTPHNVYCHRQFIYMTGVSFLRGIIPPFGRLANILCLDTELIHAN